MNLHHFVGFKRGIAHGHLLLDILVFEHHVDKKALHKGGLHDVVARDLAVALCKGCGYEHYIALPNYRRSRVIGDADDSCALRPCPLCG